MLTKWTNKVLIIIIIHLNKRIMVITELMEETREVKDGTSFRYAQAESRTRVVAICDPTCYQVDQRRCPRIVWIYP